MGLNFFEKLTDKQLLAVYNHGTEKYKECRDEATKPAFQKGSRFL